MVQTDLGSAEGELASITVEEALYDGQRVIALLRLSPKDPENHALLNDMLQNTPEDIYNIELVPMTLDEGESVSIIEDGVEREPTPEEITCYQVITGRKDGKTILNYGVRLTVAGQDTRASADAEEQQDGSVLVWYETDMFEGTGDESIQCEAIVTILLNDERETLSVPFALQKTEPEQTVSIVPTEDNMPERFQVLSGALSCTKVRGKITVDYLYEESENEPMGITLRFYDAEGNPINTGSGYTDIEETESGTIYHETTDIQSFEALPEKIIIEAKVIDNDATLGRVECQLIANE